MGMLHNLPAEWPDDPDLRARVVQWSWFAPAFGLALERAAARHGVQARLDDDRLCQVFFAWVHELEMHDDLEAHDPVDFRHVMAGLLLQQLLSAQQHGTGADGVVSLPASGTSDHADGAATLITALVLGLLQALRLQIGAPSVSIDTALAQYWNSYLENVAQDPATAICYLDRMTGLEPVWDTPTLIGARPAMRAPQGAGHIA